MRRDRLTWLRGLALGIVLPLALAGCKSTEERIEDHFTRGQAFVVAGEDEKARLEFANVLGLKGDHLPALREVAALYERAGNLQDMASHLLLITEIDPGDWDARMRLARLLARTGQLTIAIDKIGEVLEGNPHHVEALALRAAVSYQLGDVSGALVDAARAIELQPMHPGAGAVLVNDRIQNADYDAAHQLNTHYLTANVQDLNLNLLHLQILSKMGRVDAIGPQLVLMVDRFPDLPRFRIGLAEWHAEAGNVDAAIEQYRAFSAVLPGETGPALELVGFLQRHRGDAAARSELERLAETSTPAFPYQIALARFDVGLGDTQTATARLATLGTTAEDQADRHTAQIMLAGLKLEADDMPGAAALSDAVLAENPDDAEALAIRANLLLRKGDVEPALVDLRRAVTLSTQSPGLYLLLAEAYRMSDNDTLSGENIARAMQLAEYAEPYTMRYADYLEQRGRLGAVETVLTEAARRRANSRAILSRLAQVRLRLGMWNKAEDIASVLGTLDDGAGVAARIRAAALSGQDRHGESLAMLRDLTNAAAAPGAVLRDLIAAYIRAGQPDEARAVLERVLARTPNNAQALALRSAFHEADGDPASAETDLRATILADPAHPMGYELLADLYARQGKTALREAVIARGLEQNPAFAGLRLRRAGDREIAGDVPGALAEYEMLLEQAPGYLIAINNVVSLITDNYADDPGRLAHALQLAPQLAGTPVPQFQDTYGWALYLGGDVQGALRALIPAAEMLPDNPWVRFHLGMALSKAEQHEAAARHLRAALDLAGDATFAARPVAEAALLGLGN